MAQSDRQGTGRHPHKDTEEPYPHTKENANESGRHSGSTHSSASDRSTHGSASGRSTHGSSHSGGADKSRGHDASESSDLKRREYRDEKGETHHHTRTYMEQHKGDNRK